MSWNNLISKRLQAKACDVSCVLCPPLSLTLGSASRRRVAAVTWGRRQCRRSTRRLSSRGGDLRAEWRVSFFSLFLVSVFRCSFVVLLAFQSRFSSQKSAKNLKKKTDKLYQNHSKKTVKATKISRANRKLILPLFRMLWTGFSLRFFIVFFYSFDCLAPSSSAQCLVFCLFCFLHCRANCSDYKLHTAFISLLLPDLTPRPELCMGRAPLAVRSCLGRGCDSPPLVFRALARFGLV